MLLDIEAMYARETWASSEDRSFAIGAHVRTLEAHGLLDREVMYARETWAGSEDRSLAIGAHVRTLEAHVAALIVQTSSLQTQLTTAL
nr:hypothetical protein [Tanacetum cinerariifolium]